MNRLVQRRSFARTAAHRWNQADRACPRGGFIAPDISEKIRREDDIELLRAKNDLHRSIVDVEMPERDFRIFSSYIGDRLAPERGSCEHIGFIDAGQATPAAGSEFEGITGPSL